MVLLVVVLREADPSSHVHLETLGHRRDVVSRDPCHLEVVGHPPAAVVEVVEDANPVETADVAP